MIIAVAVVLAGAVAFAQGQGKAVQNEYTESWEGVLVAGCIDGYGGMFDVMNRYDALIKDTTVYNKKGQIEQIVRTVKFTTDIFWNSETRKSLTGGPGERQNIRLTFEDGVLVRREDSGGIVRVHLPGYGPIYYETGHARINPDTYEVHFNSGWNHFFDGDPAAAEALCNALK